MQKRMIEKNPDWDQLRVFFHVANEGTFSGAARKMGTNQSTISRQMLALEREIGDPLFVRSVHGVTLTPAGEKMLTVARPMHEAYMRYFDEMHNETVGTVRLTTSVFVAHFILPEFLTLMRQTYPEIQIDVIASDKPENILFREVDIAVRHVASAQSEVISKKIGEINFGIYASKTFLRARGRPKSLDEITNFDLVGFDKNNVIIMTMLERGWDVSRQNFAIRTDNQSLYWTLIEQGCGIGFGQCNVGDKNPQLERLFPDIVVSTMPVWLVASEALRFSKRQRIFWNSLQTYLKSQL